MNYNLSLDSTGFFKRQRHLLIKTILFIPFNSPFSGLTVAGKELYHSAVTRDKSTQDGSNYKVNDFSTLLLRSASWGVRGDTHHQVVILFPQLLVCFLTTMVIHSMDVFCVSSEVLTWFLVSFTLLIGITVTNFPVLNLPWQLK